MKSELFDEKLFIQKADDLVRLSKEDFEEKYRKFPEKVEFEFIIWYSGIEKKKVLNAYQRWKLENNIE
jgi:hypothetical protein